MDAKTALSKRENFQELLDTVKEDFKPMRQKLKEKPFDLDNQDENGKTVLINIVELRGNTEQMWVLLDYGADPNIQDNEGKTALHHSCIVDRKDMMICLLLFGADPEIEDNEGKKCFEDYKDDMSLIKEKIDDVLNDPNTEIGRRFNDDGTVAYKGSDGTIVIHNPNDTAHKGTVFKPQNPDEYFNMEFPND